MHTPVTAKFAGYQGHDRAAQKIQSGELGDRSKQRPCPQQTECRSSAITHTITQTNQPRPQPRPWKALVDVKRVGRIAVPGQQYKQERPNQGFQCTRQRTGMVANPAPQCHPEQTRPMQKKQPGVTPIAPQTRHQVSALVQRKISVRIGLIQPGV